MIRTYCDICDKERPVSQPLLGGWGRLFCSMGYRDICDSFVLALYKIEARKDAAFTPVLRSRIRDMAYNGDKWALDRLSTNLGMISKADRATNIQINYNPGNEQK